MHPKDADGMVNSLNPDQTALWHCLLRHICPNTLNIHGSTLLPKGIRLNHAVSLGPVMEKTLVRLHMCKGRYESSLFGMSSFTYIIIRLYS